MTRAPSPATPERRALRASIFIAVALLVVVFVATEARWWLRCQLELHPARVVPTVEERAQARRDLPSLREVTFRTRDGLKLVGWFSPGRRRDAIVLVHGLGANRAALLPTARLLARHGHGVLLYDSRASGESEGDVATWGDLERNDVQAALDYVSQRQDVSKDRLGLYGFSVGATTVALVSAADPRVAAVALGPTWTSLAEELADKHGRWGLLSLFPARLAFRSAGVAIDALRPVDVIASIPPRPLLMLGGDEDKDTPPAVMRRLHSRVPASEYWVVPGIGHASLAKADPVAFEAHFCAFFDHALPEE